MPTIAVVAIVVAAVALVAALVTAWAKSHTVRRSDEVWEKIEHIYGAQHRSSWAYAVDPTTEAPMVVAVSSEAFYIVLGHQVARLPWASVDVLSVSPEGTGLDAFVLGGMVELPGRPPTESGQRFRIDVPGQRALPIKREFIEALTAAYRGSRPAPGTPGDD